MFNIDTIDSKIDREPKYIYKFSTPQKRGKKGERVCATNMVSKLNECVCMRVCGMARSGVHSALALFKLKN